VTRPNQVAVRAVEAPSGQFTRALRLTSLSTFVAMLAYSGPLGNAPALTASLRASQAGGTWVLSSMSVGLAVSLLCAGALADEIGRRRVFTTGAWVFAAGSVLCAVAGGSLAFIIGRLVEGLGAAGIVATGLGLVSGVTTGVSQPAAAASWWGASMGAGIALGPLLTGLLDLAEWWRAFYWLLAITGAGVAVAATRAFTETSHTSARRPDIVGAGLMTSGLGLLLAALVETREANIALATTGGAAALLAIASFVVRQIRGSRPMLDPALFRRHDFVAATVAAFTTGVGVIALMSFACTFLVTGMGTTTLEAGAILVLWSGTSAISAVLGRRLPPRYLGHPQLVVGLAGVGIGMLALTGLSSTSTPARLAPGLLVAGVASGILNVGLGRQAVASVPPQRAALGTGTNNTARYVGSSIGVTVVSVLAATPGSSTGDLMTGWNRVALLTATASLAGALAVALLARRT
jgi:MFS family permease